MAWIQMKIALYKHAYPYRECAMSDSDKCTTHPIAVTTFNRFRPNELKGIHHPPYCKESPLLSWLAPPRALSWVSEAPHPKWFTFRGLNFWSPFVVQNLPLKIWEQFFLPFERNGLMSTVTSELQLNKLRLASYKNPVTTVQPLPNLCTPSLTRIRGLLSDSHTVLSFTSALTRRWAWHAGPIVSIENNGWKQMLVSKQ